jgi:hypothetical protein
MSQEVIEGKITGIKILERLVKVSGLFRKVHDTTQESALHTVVYQGYIANQPQQRKVKFVYDNRSDEASAEFSNDSNEILNHDMKVNMAKYQVPEVKDAIKGVTDK